MDAGMIRDVMEELRENGRAEVQVQTEEDVTDLVNILYREGLPVFPDRLERGRWRLVPRDERAVR